MFLLYVQSFFKQGDTNQGGTLLKGGHYLRKYSICLAQYKARLWKNKWKASIFWQIKYSMFLCGFHMQNALTLELWSRDSIHIPCDHAATLELGQLRHKLERKKKNGNLTFDKFPLNKFSTIYNGNPIFFKQKVRNRKVWNWHHMQEILVKFVKY